MNEVDEKTVYQGRPSWLSYIGLYVAGIVLFAIFKNAGHIVEGLFVLVFVLCVAAVLRLRYKFTMTNDRVIMRVGLIAKNTNEIQLRHIRAMNVRQGIIERLLSIGTIEMSSAAGGGVEVMFKRIRDPHRVKERVRGLENEQ
ncbi:MAG: hypothetical protein COW04_01140 [Deltaproteobacteria bacterium CG12_big_fil_rev_8_21_14_0_65_43_10]|nr:MAG: hypothetical protein AUK23_06005 [Deltaproteobacteria bacterium CG2_30_43_15]PIQ46621.1 MAG: hypothetical protein COW04_01140 [Deltaproteobacteria bacterium CG12_big_fil_rev_8_21_14_0_65_43_10]PIU84916.1 MAG: hypothetical protein COS67_10625 [Deltaproteobacteria bacterium CG06_land_8_20_14_3_00_44_19]PIX23219.1 MAG: hypothetical protein COZ68_09990 [Deltaproteobacteria bacterium CG_4_8_14_3_um_filter_43_13]PIZ19817.1 MAG: hypothetical protein COY50_07980 [Deltaproteobacteria bacterium C